MCVDSRTDGWYVGSAADLRWGEPLPVAFQLAMRDLEQVDAEDIGEAQQVDSDVGQFVVDVSGSR